MAERIKVLARLKTWDSKNNYGFLEAEGITPDIHLNKSTLEQKKCTNTNPKVGDEFEVEIEPTTYQKNPSWKIITIKAMEKKFQLENFAIKLHKDNFAKTLFENQKNDNKDKGKNKSTKPFDLKRLFNDLNKQNIFGETQVADYYKGICERDKKLAEILTDSQLKVLTFKPEEHLIVGLGGGSVYETSITLHHIYGFPYIPATAIKGVLRSYLILNYFEGNEGKAFENKVMCDIFGCPKEIKLSKETRENYKMRYGNDKVIGENYNTHYKEERQGKIIFFDAMPTDSPANSITLDIMNPHFSNYYSDNKNKTPPDDFKNPIPIIFLKVKNLSFQVMVGLSKGVENEVISHFANKENKDILSLVDELLVEALENHGIGAKTAVGYGYMKKV